MKRLMLLPVLFLAACGTPQEQCISANTRDLQVVDRLIRMIQVGRGELGDSLTKAKGNSNRAPGSIK